MNVEVTLKHHTNSANVQWTTSFAISKALKGSVEICETKRNDNRRRVELELQNKKKPTSISLMHLDDR